MTQTLLTNEKLFQWVDVCFLSDIAPNTGVCALIEDQQIAIFRIESDFGTEVYALSNYDPFSKAYVIARGILGDRKGILKVASPIYKQNFSLTTGKCLDDETVIIPTYPVRIIDGQILVSVQIP